MEKNCTKCKVLKGLDNFYTDTTKKDSKGSECKQCTRERQQRTRHSEKPIISEKPCNKCRKIKPSTEFTVTKYTSTGFARNCKDCEKSWRMARTKDQRDDNYLYAAHRIRKEDYKRMLEEQDHKCAICFREAKSMLKNFCVDHCHTTGKIRGLLCVGCNGVLGRFHDDADRFQSACDYLKRTK